MAKIIKTDGAEREVHPASRRGFSVEELQEFCGGYVKPITLHDGRVMYVNDLGTVYRMDVNAQATEIADEAGALEQGDIIVGDVLICSEEDVQ